MDTTQIQEIMHKLIEVGIPLCLNLVAAIIIYLVGKWLARFVSVLIESVLIKGNVDGTLAKFTKNIVYVAILVFAIIAAVGKIGVQTASLIAVLGAAGLAVGLALQGTLSNFASGVMLILFRPFKLNDFVEAGGVLGTVQEIQIFHTVLSSPDNRKIILPNSKISESTITNFTDIDRRRIDLIFGISYGDDMKKAKEALLSVVNSNDKVLKDPAPVIAVSALADSSVNLICRPWVKPADYWAVYFDVVERGKLALEAAGCTIPFPQRDVHVYQETTQTDGLPANAGRL